MFVCLFVCVCVCLSVPPQGQGQLGLIKTFASFTFLTIELLLSYPKLGPHYLYHISCHTTSWTSNHKSRFFPRQAYQNRCFFHLSYNRITSIKPTVFVPKLGLPGLYQKLVRTTSTIFPVTLFPTQFFFILWSSYVCRIIQFFWLVMNS